MPVLICPRKKTLNEGLFYEGSSASLPRLHTCENKVPFWDKSKFFASQYIYIYIYIYIRGAINKFSDFFVLAFKIVVDSWKFGILLLYILWDNWPIFMISSSNEELQQQLEYTLLKPDCHSWWISKMQSGLENT